MSEDQENNAETIERITAQAIDPKDLDGRNQILALPHSMKIADLEEYQERPRLKSGQLVVSDPMSLADYLNTHGDEHTLIIAERPEHRIRVTLDHHEVDLPRWGKHKATMQLRLDERWKAWLSLDGKQQGHRQFAEMIEDRLLDITKPAAADLLDTIKTLTAVKSGSFMSSVDLVGANQRVSLTSEVAVKAKTEGVEIPRKITISLPTYEDQATHDIEVRIRVRADGESNLSCGYRIANADLVQRNAFKAVVQEFEDAHQLEAQTYYA